MKTKLELETLKISELREYAKELEIVNTTKLKKDMLIEEIIKEQSKQEFEAIESENPAIVEGILEVLEDGYGFIRSDNYLSGPDDVFVSPTFIRKFNLKTGDWIRGKSRMQREGEGSLRRLFRLLQMLH